MLDSCSQTIRRLLLVDDNPEIHNDYRRILSQGNDDNDPDNLAGLEAELFGTVETEDTTVASYSFTSCFQGKDAIETVKMSLAKNVPFFMAFMDVRMPPGMDGVATTKQLLKVDLQIQIVICSAYSDHSWNDIVNEFGGTDRVLILKKPFDPIEIRQLAASLEKKWELSQAVVNHIHSLEEAVQKRTLELQETNSRLREEILQKEKFEQDLRLAQKMEAIGQLAAGVAHEINTPLQYVADNLSFIADASTDCLALISTYRKEIGELQVAEEQRCHFDKIQDHEEEIEIDYVAEELDPAIIQARDGLEQVSKIVKALKEFAHTGSSEHRPFDIVHAVSTSITVARNQLKYVANIETDLQDLPMVVGNEGEIKQVILNLLVNAAHAIEDKKSDSDSLGTIEIKTAQEDNFAVITIRDTGVGISKELTEKIFDPFFTTKDVGRGSGQGLAIARTIIVEKHGGKLDFESEAGCGTTFFIRIPISSDGSGTSSEYI